MKLAKDLVGNFANLRPDNPARFLEAISKVLERYPLGIASEAADPLCGIASKVEFLSVKSLVDWCEHRQTFYRSLAAYIGAPSRPKERDFTVEEMERGGAAMKGLWAAVREGKDVRAMTFDQAVELGKTEAA